MLIKRSDLFCDSSYNQYCPAGFSGSEIVGGGYWRTEYSYIQTEANLVYTYKHLRTFAGVGWAIHDDGKYAPNGAYLGSDNNVWVGGGIGWIF